MYLEDIDIGTLCNNPNCLRLIDETLYIGRTGQSPCNEHEGGEDGALYSNFVETADTEIFIDLEEIYEFLSSKHITRLIIEEGCKSIWTLDFLDSTKLIEIVLPKSLNSVKFDMFSRCSNLKYIKVDPQNEIFCTIDGVLYSKSMDLLCVVPPARCDVFRIPDGVKDITYCAFAGCTKLTGIYFPSGIKQLSRELFSDCNSLEYIHVDARNPDYVSGNGALCSKEKEEKKILFVPPGMSGMYRIPDDVTTIGYRAFANCSHLTEIIIPKKLRGVSWMYGGSHFNDCSSLKRIEVAADHEYCISVDGVVYSKKMDSIVCVPAGRKGTFTIPETVKYIYSGAFEGCTGLKKIVMPMGVVEVGTLAFSSCSALCEIELPDGVLCIDYRAFADCKQLRNITIPNNVNLISQEAFAGCTALKEINIPESVTFIGIRAFADCTKLAKATLTTQIVDLGDWWDCNWYGDKLDWSQEQKTVTELRTSVFSGCAADLEIGVRIVEGKQKKEREKNFPSEHVIGEGILKSIVEELFFDENLEAED